MVKFRGIEIDIVSQFDIRKLPEFHYRAITSSPTDPFVEKGHSPVPTATASCYVPIYAGSQIWFEYSIEGPHPPGAGYFFKLFLGVKLVTSWDCTEKHDYQGKMMYNLTCNKGNSDAPELVRQALAFSSATNEEVDPADNADVAEIRVYRIEHRQRIRQLEAGLGENAVVKKQFNGVQLINGGPLEPGFPQKRYKYQLLDPIDEPYATFRFHYRTLDFLKRHGIIDTAPNTSTSPVSSTNEASSAVQEFSTPKEVKEDCTNIPIESTSPGIGSPDAAGHHVHLPPSNSAESLSIVAKDSIEELNSNVPRSPKSPHQHPSPQTLESILESSPEQPPPPSPSRLSPCRLFKKNLSVKINGVDFDLERKRRPLSPFTSGGMLRRLMPSTAPPTVTEPGPTVKAEVEKLEEKVRKNQQADTPPVPKIHRTTRAERGGSQLMGFLARRIQGRK